MSMREVEPGVSLVMSTVRLGGSDPSWNPRPTGQDDAGGDA
jgi:hypothetical protein